MAGTPCLCAGKINGVCQRQQGPPYVRGRDCASAYHYANTPHMRAAWGGDPNAPDIAHRHTPEANPAPLRMVRVDGSRLANGPATSAKDGHSNASIIRWQGKLVMAYRHRWHGAEIWITELDDDTYQPKSVGVRLNLSHHHAQYGTDDPRLFIHANRLCVSFVGVEGRSGPSSQLYASLDDSLAVSRIVFLDMPARKEWEKNWTLFDHDGGLYAVYSISPHVVLRVHPDGRCDRAFETKTPHGWSGGPLRGGASPVRVGDEFITWFHGQVTHGGIKTYTAGVYSYEAKPPFKVTRMTPSPVMYGDSHTRPASWNINNWFPCGAILENNTWIVSAGEHDQFVSVAEWDSADICKRLLTTAGAKAANPCGCK